MANCRALPWCFAAFVSCCLFAATTTADAKPPPKKAATKSKKEAPAAEPAKDTPRAETPPPSDLAPGSGFSGATRLDFDDRLIQGQSNKSGAVYLFDRKETGISSMVSRRKSFKQLTLQTIYDR